MKKAASAQALRIAPFEYRPFPVLEKVLRNANHFRGAKFSCKPCSNGFAAFYRALGYLMVDRVRMVKLAERIGVRLIERINPRLY